MRKVEERILIADLKVVLVVNGWMLICKGYQIQEIVGLEKGLLLLLSVLLLVDATAAAAVILSSRGRAAAVYMYVRIDGWIDD